MRMYPSLTVAMLIGISSPSPALAGVPIPCTGDKPFKLAETGLKRPDGRTVYLGYKYSGCSAGTWIGYIDRRNYMTLKDESQATLLALAGGMKVLPEPPGRLSNPKEFWVEWLWAFLVGIGIASTILSGTAKSAEASSRDGSVSA